MTCVDRRSAQTTSPFFAPLFGWKINLVALFPAQLILFSWIGLCKGHLHTISPEWPSHCLSPCQNELDQFSRNCDVRLLATLNDRQRGPWVKRALLRGCFYSLKPNVSLSSSFFFSSQRSNEKVIASTTTCLNSCLYYNDCDFLFSGTGTGSAHKMTLLLL